MTIQALAWAIEQPIPGPSKLVLMSLANHADHTNGYCHLDLSTIAHEATLPIRSLWRYFGALERNGYLAKDERKSKDVERRDYWLILDRDQETPWSWAAHDGDTQEDVEGRDGPDADYVSRAPRPSATSGAPSTFSRARQAKDREIATTPSPDQVAGVPVIEGTEAFKAWCAHCRSRGFVPPFVQTVMVQGKPLRGFYMPTLFPPRREETANLDEVGS